jgi:hypothetical protein
MISVYDWPPISAAVPCEMSQNPICLPFSYTLAAAVGPSDDQAALADAREDGVPLALSRNGFRLGSSPSARASACLTSLVRAVFFSFEAARVAAADRAQEGRRSPAITIDATNEVLRMFDPPGFAAGRRITCDATTSL